MPWGGLTAPSVQRQSLSEYEEQLPDESRISWLRAEDRDDLVVVPSPQTGSGHFKELRSNPTSGLGSGSSSKA